MDTNDGLNMDAEARAQFQSIIDALSPETRLYVAKLPREHIFMIYHGLGTYIRNRHRHGELNALFLWSRGQPDVETGSLDGLSWPILVALWTALRSYSEEKVEALDRPQASD